MKPLMLAPTECCVLRLAAHANPRFVEEYAATENPLLVGVCVSILENTYHLGWGIHGPNDSVRCFYHALAIVERERLKLAQSLLPCRHQRGEHEQAIGSLLEKFTVTAH
ncbi:MAG: hypothetical protein AAB490_04145 [Patescibacteria group bacterium]